MEPGSYPTVDHDDVKQKHKQTNKIIINTFSDLALQRQNVLD